MKKISIIMLILGMMSISLIVFLGVVYPQNDAQVLEIKQQYCEDANSTPLYQYCEEAPFYYSNLDQLGNLAMILGIIPTIYAIYIITKEEKKEDGTDKKEEEHL